MPLGRAEERQLRERAVRGCLLCHAGEQGGEMLEQAPCRVLVHAGAIRPQVDGEPVPRREDQGQGIVGALVRPQVGDLQTAHAFISGVSGVSGVGIVLEDVKRLEERRAGGHLAPALDQGERGVLELLPGELALLEAPQPGDQRLVAVHPHPRRQGVDEHADHVEGAGEGGWAAGDHGAEDRFFLAAVAGEEDGPGAQGDGLEGQVVPRREGLERRRGLAGEPDLVLAIAGSPARSLRPGARAEDAGRRGAVSPASSRRQNGSAFALSCLSSQTT